MDARMIVFLAMALMPAISIGEDITNRVSNKNMPYQDYLDAARSMRENDGLKDYELYEDWKKSYKPLGAVGSSMNISWISLDSKRIQLEVDSNDTDYYLTRVVYKFSKIECSKAKDKDFIQQLTFSFEEPLVPIISGLLGGLENQTSDIRESLSGEGDYKCSRTKSITGKTYR
ncbi:MAG: hypothetical protein P1U35_10670 [Cycloclasticus sp.]|nr:hypothetical protein [Cycloclasticus sp.]